MESEHKENQEEEVDAEEELDQIKELASQMEGRRSFRISASPKTSSNLMGDRMEEDTGVNKHNFHVPK
jgi:hypothetical protein